MRDRAIRGVTYLELLATAVPAAVDAKLSERVLARAMPCQLQQPESVAPSEPALSRLLIYYRILSRR